MEEIGVVGFGLEASDSSGLRMVDYLVVNLLVGEHLL